MGNAIANMILLIPTDNSYVDYCVQLEVTIFTVCFMIFGVITMDQLQHFF